MTLEEARAIIIGLVGHSIWPRTDDLLLSDEELTVDGLLNADELEAIAIVMRADRAAHNTGNDRG